MLSETHEKGNAVIFYHQTQSVAHVPLTADWHNKLEISWLRK